MFIGNYRAASAFVLGVLALVAPDAKAGPITYTYTGNNFTSAGGPYSTSDFISASLTFASPLPDSITEVDETASVLTWSVSDQYDNFAPPNSTLYYADFSTDASGDITYWAILAYGPGALSTDPAFAGTQSTTTPNIFYYADFDAAWSQGCCSNDINQSTVTAGNTNDQGYWTESPEPSSLLLLSSGVLFLMFRRSSKFKDRFQRTER